MAAAGQFLNRVFRRFVALEVLAGRLAVDLETLADPVWLWQGWAAVDPEKETNADVAAINARIKSRREVIAGRGRDPEEVDAEIAGDPAPAPAPEEIRVKQVIHDKHGRVSHIVERAA
jgi:capsid protein